MVSPARGFYKTDHISFLKINHQIITQNLGGKKKKRRLNRKHGQIKSIVGNAVNQIFDNYGVLVSEDLSSPMKSQKKAKSVNRKLNNWTKGITPHFIYVNITMICNQL